MSYPSLLTKDSLEVILCFTLSSVTLTVQSPNSNAANWGWPKGRPSVTTDLNWSYASRHRYGTVVHTRENGFKCGHIFAQTL
jgi:hypothetical protein